MPPSKSKRPVPASSNTKTSPALGERRASILDAIVSRYIGTAQPVGSGQVADATGLHLSSATIRSEMAQLEQEGYLAQPHTSAGRIPTDKGYRYFVDHLTTPTSASTPELKKVRTFFDEVHGELEEVLERSSTLLADLTSYASVVVAPGHTSSQVRSMQLVSLEPTSVLLLVILSDGTVDKATVTLDTPIEEAVVAEASVLLDAHCRGRQMVDISPLPSSNSPAVQAVLTAVQASVIEVEQGATNDHVFVGGPSKLADAFDAVETVRSVLSILEEQLVVVSLLRDVLNSGLSVAIGQEHGFEPLASCAVIVAPLSIDGKPAGAVGLLGPTRMQYPAAMAAANAVGAELSERLNRRKNDGGAA